jgi:signal transduction histidine kinase
MYALPPRLGSAVRIVGLVLIDWSILTSGHRPGGSGRGLVVAVLLGVCSAAWLAWAVRTRADHGRDLGITAELYVMAAAGGVLCGASPGSAASAFVFAAVMAASLRAELPTAAVVGALGTLALAVATLVYANNGIGLLAYALGFAAAALAASNSRQSVARADQAELLLAQTQRSHEEQLRVTRLQESARIARDIHDVLAHTLAGLTIQLEATTALLEQDADRERILTRVRRAHELAREGLRETRRAVGALRDDAPMSVAAAVEALVEDYRAQVGTGASLRLTGRPERLSGRAGETVLRVVQEALTNARKHAPGAEVTVAVDAGAGPGDGIEVTVTDRAVAGAAGLARAPGGHELAASGGGFGLRGMRERAEELGGTLHAGPGPGPGDGGWRVELRLPPLGSAPPAPVGSSVGSAGS